MTLPLTRDTVVSAALDVLDEVGLDGLTTRRLAERLGVRSPSLYWHLRGKDELLDLIAERIMSEIDIPARERPWRERLEALLTSFRRALLAHRDGARVLAGRPPRGPAWLTVSEAGLAALLDAGLPDEEAAEAVSVVVGYVMGFALEESAPAGLGWTEQRALEHETLLRGLPADQYPTLVRLARQLSRPEVERQFGYGVAFLLDGVAGRGQAIR